MFCTTHLRPKPRLWVMKQSYNSFLQCLYLLFMQEEFRIKHLWSVPLTHKELAVELEVDVPLSGGFLHWCGVMVYIQRRLFDVPLCHHVVPALIIERSRSLHTHLERPVPNIKGEDDLGRHWKETQGSFLITVYLFIYSLIKVWHAIPTRITQGYRKSFKMSVK